MPAPVRHTFPKSEHLKSEREIKRLFSKEGKAFNQYPIRWVWVESEDEGQDYPVRVAVSVSKRKFKRAVDRNRIKRLLREAWRLNKTTLELPDGERFSLMLVYIGKEELPFREIEAAMKRGMVRFRKYRHAPPMKKRPKR